MKDGNEEDVLNMKRLQDGDDVALNALIGRWKKPLVSFCLRYTGNFEDAREIAQETFVKVYHNRHRYRPKAAFSTWLFAIAVNLCRMRARWRSRHPEVLETDRAFAAISEVTVHRDPAMETDAKALAADLQRAIEELSHDRRACFVLFEVEGVSYREIAAILGCSEKAVERRLARAREDLRVALKPKWR